MSPRSMVAPWLALALAACSAAEPRGAAAPPAPPREAVPVERPARAFAYPRPRVGDVVDDYHGVKIQDPYRALEDPDAPDTRAFVAAENALTRAYLDAVPGRAALRRRLTQLWDFERWGVPSRFGDRLFYSKNDGLQNQAVYYAQPLHGGAPEVLVDPNTLSADGTVALGFTSPSEDGARLAYGLTQAGSDWTTIHVLDVKTRRALPDELHWVKFSDAAWTRDGRGFFYVRFPEPPPGAARDAPNYSQRLYFHELGAAQSEDTLVYERRRDDEKTWTFEPSVSDDGRFLVVTVARSTDDRRRVLVADLGKPWGKGHPPALVELVANFDAGYSFVGSAGPALYFRTNSGAPRGRVVSIDARGGAGAPRTTEIVPEAAEPLVSAHWAAHRLFLCYLKDAHSEVRITDARGKLERVLPLPGIGSVRGFTGRPSDPETYFSFTSFGAPQVVYSHAPATNTTSVVHAPRLGFDPAAFETRQVFATSKDGTRVPLFLTQRRAPPPTSPAPTYLYGYGGFNVSVTPFFDVASLVWMELGGVYAVANLRGGGEYGKPWHEAGMRERKQNVFDDFVAAAERLVDDRVTIPARLAIGGRSNGGLLVGAALTQRPDLFGAALPGVGVLDMLRYHRFTIGWAWAEEYGAADDPAAFPHLLAYSPLHRVREGTRYPATLITTADHDDRVVPAHSLKFAAALQAAQAGDAPILLRVETEVGHGAATPTNKRLDEEADRLAFLVRTLGMDTPGAPSVPGSLSPR